MPQNEILRPLPLLDDSGMPFNFGWARQPVFIFNPIMLYVPMHRRTASDRYIVHSPTHTLVFEIRDDGWLGQMSISVISMRDRKRSTQVYKTSMPLGSYQMPAQSDAGSARWRRKKTMLNFITMESGAKIIKVDIPQFGRHRSLRGAIVLTSPHNSHSLVTNQPWRDDKKTFRYTRCSPWYFAEGMIQFSGTEIIFNRGNAWGILDWYRCVRPKADIRYWAAASGFLEERQLSFCVGYSMADFSLGTENGFFVDGVLHKLDQVTFHIPLSNWLSPWRFTSNDNRLEMTFHPHQERIERKSLLFHSSTRRQVCGFFSGKVQLDDGSVIEFHNLTGFAERSKMQF